MLRWTSKRSLGSLINRCRIWFEEILPNYFIVHVDNFILLVKRQCVATGFTKKLRYYS